jgi:hypothetical protein
MMCDACIDDMLCADLVDIDQLVFFACLVGDVTCGMNDPIMTGNNVKRRFFIWKDYSFPVDTFNYIMWNAIDRMMIRLQ